MLHIRNVFSIKLEVQIMKYVSFTDSEKIKMFDKIADMFYESNFGQASKAEIELMMFHFYITKMIEASKGSDMTIDYSKCSDYKISKELGITQQRVRNLKVKNQLIYPIDYDWKKEFAKLTSNARFENQKVIVSIPDPNLFYDIQNYLEEKWAYIEKQLNSKLLVIRAEYYIDLTVSLEPEINRKKVVKGIQKEFKAQQKNEVPFNEKNIGKSLISGAINITTLVANISSLFSPENVIFKAFAELIENRFL